MQIIKRAESELFDWTIFVDPLSLPFWVVLAIHTLGLLLVTRMFWLYYRYEANEGRGSGPGPLSAVWATFKNLFLFFSAYFGRSLSSTIVQFGDKFRSLLFAYSLAGTVVWISYRASLTSNLSTREYKFPFSSMASLLETDYT